MQVHSKMHLSRPGVFTIAVSQPVWLHQRMPNGQDRLHTGRKAHLIQVSSALDYVLRQAAAGCDLQRQAVTALPLCDVPGRLQARLACTRQCSAVSAVVTRQAMPGQRLVLRHAILLC